MARTRGSYAHVRERKTAAVSRLSSYVIPQLDQAKISSLVGTALCVRDAAVSSAADVRNAMLQIPSKMSAPIGQADIPHEKLAHAALTIDRLVELVGELRQAQDKSVKAAAALAGAVKLAQDGAIDVEDILDTAREALNRGHVKLSAVDELYEEQPGDLVTGEQPKAQGTADPLTMTLRSLRR